MAEAGDLDVQVAALALIPRRRMADAEVTLLSSQLLPRLRGNHQSVLDDVFELSREQLDRSSAWTEGIAKALSVKMDRSIRGLAAAELERLLSTQSQSIRDEEAGLSLPLKWHKGSVAI